MRPENKIFAEFMKNEAINSPHLYPDLTEYDTSWDALHTVIDKIHRLYCEAVPSNDEFVRRIINHENIPVDEYIEVVAMSIAVTIEEAYETVLKFITWYNDNKSFIDSSTLVE